MFLGQTPVAGGEGMPDSSPRHVLLSSLMITDHWVSANSYFHREEVGSSWSDGVVLEAGQPSAGKAHLEEKQSIMGGCPTV